MSLDARDVSFTQLLRFCLSLSFLPERDYVTFGSLLSQIRLLSATLMRPTQEVQTFSQYFFAALYLSHSLTSVQKFTEIVPGEPNRRGR